MSSKITFGRSDLFLQIILGSSKKMFQFLWQRLSSGLQNYLRYGNVDEWFLSKSQLLPDVRSVCSADRDCCKFYISPWRGPYRLSPVCYWIPAYIQLTNECSGTENPIQNGLILLISNHYFPPNIDTKPINIFYSLLDTLSPHSFRDDLLGDEFLCSRLWLG
jgi:hypothetical protein